MNNLQKIALGVLLAAVTVASPVFAQVDTAPITAAGTDIEAGVTAVGAMLISAAGVYVVFKWVKGMLKSG